MRGRFVELVVAYLHVHLFVLGEVLPLLLHGLALAVVDLLVNEQLWVPLGHALPGLHILFVNQFTGLLVSFLGGYVFGAYLEVGGQLLLGGLHWQLDLWQRHGVVVLYLEVLGLVSAPHADFEVHVEVSLALVQVPCALRGLNREFRAGEFEAVYALQLFLVFVCS